MSSSADDFIRSEIRHLDWQPEFMPGRWLDVTRQAFRVLRWVNGPAWDALQAQPGTSIVNYDPEAPYFEVAASHDPDTTLLFLDRLGLVDGATWCAIGVLAANGEILDRIVRTPKPVDYHGL